MRAQEASDGLFVKCLANAEHCPLAILKFPPLSLSVGSVLQQKQSRAAFLERAVVDLVQLQLLLLFLFRLDLFLDSLAMPFTFEQVNAVCAYNPLGQAYLFPAPPFTRKDTFALLELSTETARCFQEQKEVVLRDWAQQVLNRDENLKARIERAVENGLNWMPLPTRDGNAFAMIWGPEADASYGNRFFVRVSRATFFSLFEPLVNHRGATVALLSCRRLSSLRGHLGGHFQDASRLGRAKVCRSSPVFRL